MSHTSVIAIVGRPNVGKSSLFNAILGRRTAIVHSESGVTRDRIKVLTEHDGRAFRLTDTGGLAAYNDESRKPGLWDREISGQVERALQEAAAVIMVVDVNAGLTPLDEEVARRIRRVSRPVILAANKADNFNKEDLSLEFSRLGFPDIFPVSCLHRRGIAELMDKAVSFLPEPSDTEDTPEPEPPVRIAVVGRPNTGKSSLVNKLLGEERVIVSDIPGTTRDSVNMDFEFEYRGRKIPAELIDTAGLRKKAKVDNVVEVFSVSHTEDTIGKADLIIFVIESLEDGATTQDRHIADMIKDSGKACVIAANKWDLQKNVRQKKLLDTIRETLPNMTYAPVIFTCALSGYNLPALLDAAGAATERMKIKISTPNVNRLFQEAVEKCAPPVIGTKFFKIYYGAMTRNPPPTFLLFVNDPKLCAESYLSYLNNFVRRKYDFTGLPVRIVLKARGGRKPSKSAKARGARSFEDKEHGRIQSDSSDFSD
jgi:GTP-binding protein